MKFIDRIKKILIEKEEEELILIKGKIEKIHKEYLREHEEVKNLGKEVKEYSGKKSEIQKNVIDNKELKDLENIYNFVANFSRIEKISEEIKKMPILYEDYAIYPETYPDEVIYSDELYRKYQLYEMLKDLNNKITQIKETDIKELLKSELKQDENIENTEREKEKKRIH